ncbi:MAG TPA: proteasome-activating nucleotidase [Candidatus Deferrimicrobium sp.]|nr:proteasome-activating nucleotidase [Candidatus Deferrimicrobium sp.]
MPNDTKIEKNTDTPFKNEEDSYLISYTKHLEKKIRNLEAEKQLIETEKIRLDRELRSIKTELDRMRQPPLVTADVVDLLDDGRIIVKSTTGPQFVVKYSSKIPKEKLPSGTRVALNQRTFSIVEVLPSSIDPFVQGMEVEESPDVAYADIGGLNEQIEEIRETVELPLLHPELFKKIGITPPKGVLLCGPPGTGKTLLARAVARETSTTFIRVIGSELVQKFIGEGARLVREIFAMAKEKSPSIVFIDELDAVGSRRLEVATSGDREVQRTLMQLLSILDGFDARGDVRILAATNREDILDPALLRPGRFDRIIEFPIPTEDARRQIFAIHTRGISIESSVNYESLIRSTDGASGADLKAIVTEAGMFAIREKRDIITMKDFTKAVTKVMDKYGSDECPPEMYA